VINDAVPQSSRVTILASSPVRSRVRDIWHRRSEQSRIDAAATPNHGSSPGLLMTTVTLRLVLRAANAASSSRKMKSRGARKPAIKWTLPDQLISVRLTHHAHHGRDAHAGAEKDKAFRLFPSEEEGSIRCLDLNLVTDP
jgi:hypothetical protein